MIVGELILWIVYIGLLPIGLYFLYLDEKESSYGGWKGIISSILVGIFVGTTILYLVITIDWTSIIMPIIAWWNSEV